MKAKHLLAMIVFAMVLFFSILRAQQPQSATAPDYAVSARYVQGASAGGYRPTAGAGLTLNIGGGTAWCNGTIVTYAAGTLSMTNSTTNYVYLNSASSCVPASNTSSIASTNIPIAAVTTSGGAITAIADYRTLMSIVSAGAPAFNTITSGSNTSATMTVGTGGSLAPTGSGVISANQLNGTAFAGTSTHLVAFGAANIPVDSGIVDTAAGLLAACTGCAPLASPTFTGTPALAAATATSLLSSGIVDGKAPITITTGTSATLGAGTYLSGYTFNQEATAAAAVTYTLPATATGLQYCVANSIVSGTGASDTGVLTVYPPSSSYVIYKGVINTIGGGGTHGIASAGAAADAACFVAHDATHWTVYVQSGVWTEN